MKIERMHLRNFRCFEDLTIDFDQRLTVIVAKNGEGKTAILDAIAIGLGCYLTKIPGITGISSKASDISIRNHEQCMPFTRMAWRATDRGQVINWSALRRRDEAVSRTAINNALRNEYDTWPQVGFKQIYDYALSLVKADSDGEAYILPVVAHYGTNRAIRHEVRRRRGFKKKFSRFDSLANALEPDSSFRSAFEWFNAMEDVERRERQDRRDFDYVLPELQIVRDAIVRMLPGGFGRPRIEIRPLRFVIDRMMPNGITQTLRISQLSDGYRVVLGLAMDLARRMAEANCTMIPDDLQGTSQLDFPAIALIDEIDLHLHPSWQQRVLSDLMQTFSNTQFIVSTHSPQVLSTVPSECIRILKDGGVHSAPPGSEGAEPGRLLKQVLGLDDVRPTENPATKELKEYLALVDRDQWDTPRALELRKILDARYMGNEPALLEADLHIDNKKWERGE